jgi:hypothetical protein
MCKAGAQLIDGHLFLTEKHRADMSFEKLKAKYVRNGKRQEREILDPFSLRADTVETASVLMMAGIIAHEGLHPFSTDI